MTFYEMDIDLYRQQKYCYAGAVRTTQTDIISQVCPHCHTPHLIPMKDIRLDLERGSQFPDFLHCPSGIFVVSENVLNEWEKHSVKGYQYYDAIIDNLLTKKLKVENKKKYYHIVINGFCDWDRAKSDIEIMNQCNVCGDIKYREKFETGMARFAFNLNTWNHADILKTSISNIRFCTRRISEIALRNNHTGVRFSPSEFFLAGEDRELIKRIQDLV